MAGTMGQGEELELALLGCVHWRPDLRGGEQGEGLEWVEQPWMLLDRRGVVRSWGCPCMLAPPQPSLGHLGSGVGV